MLPTYEILCVKYAERPGRRPAHFVGGDPHDVPMPMDYYEHFEQDRCFPLVYHLGEMIEGFATLRRLAESPRHIIPGHDPLVLQRYPAVSPELAGIVARLDVAPTS